MINSIIWAFRHTERNIADTGGCPHCSALAPVAGHGPTACAAALLVSPVDTRPPGLGCLPLTLACPLHPLPGLNLLHELLVMFTGSPAANPFYQAFYTQLLREVFAVMTGEWTGQ